VVVGRVFATTTTTGLCFLDGHRRPLPRKPQLNALGREMVVDEVLLSCFVGTRLCNGVEELFESRPKLATLTERQRLHLPELVEPLLPRPHRRRNHVKDIFVQFRCLLLESLVCV
jgi:hypothetical protein